MVQFCCVKGQPLAINIENAAKKYLLRKIGSIGNFFGNTLFSYVCMFNMEILVVEFSNGVYKIRKIFAYTNEHTQRIFLNFENWTDVSCTVKTMISLKSGFEILLFPLSSFNKPEIIVHQSCHSKYCSVYCSCHNFHQPLC